jgi:hypothetical protein
MPWIFLDPLGGNEPFQRVAQIPGLKKLFFPPPSPFLPGEGRISPRLASILIFGSWLSQNASCAGFSEVAVLSDNALKLLS